MPNGERYLVAGGLGFAPRAGFCSGVDKAKKMPQNPANRVHALLDARCYARLTGQNEYLIVFTGA